MDVTIRNIILSYNIGTLHKKVKEQLLVLNYSDDVYYDNKPNVIYDLPNTYFMVC